MRAVLVALALLAAVPATAGAATRYAAPDGVDAEPCDAGHPCVINRAIGSAMPNDEVILQSGDYGSAPSAPPPPVLGAAAPGRPRGFPGGGAPTAGPLRPSSPRSGGRPRPSTGRAGRESRPRGSPRARSAGGPAGAGATRPATSRCTSP